MQPAIETAPTPRFRTGHEIGSQGIPLHVTANGEEMLVLLSGK